MARGRTQNNLIPFIKKVMPIMTLGKGRHGRLPLEPIALVLGIFLVVGLGIAQGPATGVAVSVPTFTKSFRAAGKQYTYRVAGRDPALGGTTTISTTIVPVSFIFNSYSNQAGKNIVISAEPVVPKVVQSPIFQKFKFATGTTQYGDAVQRAEFYGEAVSKNSHTLLGQPRVTPTLLIRVPAADGYVLTSKRTGHRLALVDLDFVQKQLFVGLSQMRLGKTQLVIALTRDVDFYPLHDATVCCSWGAYGVHVDAGTKKAQAFILGTYLDPGTVPDFSDIQTLSALVAEWMNDPLQGYEGNVFPYWRKPSGKGYCGGKGEGTFYRLAEPADSLPGMNATTLTLHGTVYHVENVALLAWYAENPHPDSFGAAYSFPDTHALTAPAVPCSAGPGPSFHPTALPLPRRRNASGHELIGYWAGGKTATSFPLRDVSPQWDVVIVAFAPPVKGSTSVLHFEPPAGYTEAQFKADIEYLQAKGRKVLISLGGGGQVVTLNTAEDARKFVGSVTAIVQEYGFNGVDLDFETPSLILNPGDTDFRKPTTPAIVNLISAMRQLHRHFGPKFMIAEVPEGPQVPAGLEVYAGQFGSFLPVIYGTRDILSFVDVQDYDTPPLEGMDGNYYMPDTADYYVAMTEMLLHGFPVGGNPKLFFPPLPARKVAVGFLVGESPLPAIKDAVRYLIEGKPYAGRKYRLREPGGYPDFDGVMFWNIQEDREDNYRLSNAVGPLVHALPVAGATSQGER